MDLINNIESLTLHPIGRTESKLVELEDCPLQETENAPEAYLEIYPEYAESIKDIQVGDQIVVLTWLHLADRKVLSCYKGSMVGSKQWGVFSTRSPDRPNPIGLHTVTVLEIVNSQRLKVDAIEVLNGTQVIDIKPIL